MDLLVLHVTALPQSLLELTTHAKAFTTIFSSLFIVSVDALKKLNAKMIVNVRAGTNNSIIGDTTKDVPRPATPGGPRQRAALVALAQRHLTRVARPQRPRTGTTLAAPTRCICAPQLHTHPALTITTEPNSFHVI